MLPHIPPSPGGVGRGPHRIKQAEGRFRGCWFFQKSMAKLPRPWGGGGLGVLRLVGCAPWRGLRCSEGTSFLPQWSVRQTKPLGKGGGRERKRREGRNRDHENKLTLGRDSYHRIDRTSEGALVGEWVGTYSLTPMSVAPLWVMATPPPPVCYKICYVLKCESGLGQRHWVGEIFCCQMLLNWIQAFCLELFANWSILSMEWIQIGPYHSTHIRR